MRSVIIASKAALFAILALSTPAHAQLPSFLSCIDQTQSWSRGFTGAIASVTYIASMPLAPAPPTVLIRPLANTMGWLIGVTGPGAHAVNILIGVPSNVAAQYQRLTNADAAFASARTRFHELLLIDGTNCPLLAEDSPFSATGAPIWSR